MYTALSGKGDTFCMEMNLLIITKQRCWCLPVRGEIVVRAHSIMSEETLCSVFSGFYKKKDTSQSWELKEHFSVVSASPTCIQTLSCKHLSTHNNLCADTCQCDQSHACLCTVPYAHKQLLWMQDLFTRTSKPHQVIKFHQDSKAEPKRSIDAGKANTHSMSQGSSQIPSPVLFGHINLARLCAEGCSSHRRDGNSPG